MALSNAERQRRHYQRQKERKKAELKHAESTDLRAFTRTPFFEFFDAKAGGFSDFSLCFDMAGLETPSIDDDSDPKSLSGEVELSFEDEPERNPYARGGGSLGRAEIMVGCLIDAASELARIINDYKRKEINDRIQEIEIADLSDPDTKTSALADIVKYRKMLDQLDRQIRWSFPQWKVTGE